MFAKAGLNTEGISNHSLRTTGISRMYNKGIAEKLIMERSGHLSAAGVRSYERTTSLQQQAVSDTLSTVAAEDSGTKKKVLSCIQPSSSLMPEMSKEGSEAPGQENEVHKMLKHINFGTINFNFQ